MVFADESELSERPHRTRTWAPKGQTPVLQYHFTRKTLRDGRNHLLEFLHPAVSGGRSQSADHRIFHAPASDIPGKLLIIWGGLRAHRSPAVWEFVR